RMAALGFDSVDEMPVTVPRWERGELEARILTPYPRAVVAVALGGSVGTPEGGIEAPITAFPDLAALRDAPEGSLDGRIAYIGDRMERRQDGRGYGAAVGKRGGGAVEAARRGALAVLIRSAGTSRARVAHTGAMRYDDAVPRIPALALSNADADALERLLEEHETVRFH